MYYLEQTNGEKWFSVLPICFGDLDHWKSFVDRKNGYRISSFYGTVVHEKQTDNKKRL